MSSQFNVKNHLGPKTYWLFLLKNGFIALIFFGLMVILIVFASLDSSVGSEAVHAFLILGVLFTAFLFLLLSIIAVLWTWIEYRNYTFILDEHALEVSRGVFNKENISIPYHHIEDINLEQSLLYQMIGVCRVVIMTAGHTGTEEGFTSYSQGILPAVDIKTGREIQEMIMHRSNFQEVLLRSKIVGPKTDPVQ